MKKTVNGNTVVSVQSMQVLIRKYDLQPDADGDIQIEQWMLREAEEWDRVHNSGPWPGRVTPKIDSL
jgi:hypothetical protein